MEEDVLGRAELCRSASEEVVLTHSGPKPMQVPDAWCGGDMPLPGGHQTGWEEEEDVEIGMWNSSSAQDVNASTHWPPYAKKLPSKVSCSSRRAELGQKWRVEWG